MGSSKQKDSLFDPYRSSFVQASPEEIVRQKLLHVMTSQLGFPRQLISVEKKLSELPHLQGNTNIPHRRADVLCFAKDIHPKYPLFPLLLIECKEGHAGDEASAQVLGYNHFVQALYVAIAGENGVFLIHPKKFSFLPRYEELLEKVCN